MFQSELAEDPKFQEFRREVSKWFHIGFYADRKWETWWCGYNVMKNPFDMWVYANIISSCHPEVVVETGTAWGGSALYMAMVMDWVGEGKVVTVDNTERFPRPRHPRISYIHGSSVDEGVVSRISRISSGHSTMVLLDSDHSCDYVLQELTAYAPLVSVGQYLVVEDTNINGHPVQLSDAKPGPYEALEQWCPQHPEFMVDPEREGFGFTFNPRGFLLRL